MTKEEIIEIAKKAGWSGIYTQWAEPTGEADWSPYKVSLTVPVTIEQIEAFAKLVTEKEREACAKLCDLTMLQNQEAINELEDDEHIAKCFIQGAMTQLVKTSKAIRARGDSK